MPTSNPYELIAAGSQQAQRAKPRVWLYRTSWVIALAAVLVLGALYGRTLWTEAAVTAGPAHAEPAAAPALDGQRSGLQAPVGQSGMATVEGQEALADLYSQAAPSVVNIQVTSRRTSPGFPGFGLPEEDEPPLQQGVGSGFIYDEQGHIVTNNHVVEDAEKVLVIFNNGYWAEAEPVAADPQADLAVLQVTPPEGVELEPLSLAGEDALRVGHTVIAIGNPFGLAGTMTTGIVSALGRGIPVGDLTVTRYTLPDVIQTDAAINPGNSGGPLLNLNGEVVGVNFAIRSQVRANVGVGFAIPVSILRRVVPSLIEEGRYPYAYLGLRGSTINASLADILDLPSNLLGVYISEVLPGGPSASAGLQGGGEVVVDDVTGMEMERGGDIVTAIDGNQVVRFEDLVSYLVIEAAPGQTVTLTVMRDDQMLEIPVTLGERPATTGSDPSVASGEDELNAREAIAIASEAAEEAGVLTGEVDERLATPGEVDGRAVWVVELVAGSETVVVAVDAITGEVLSLDTQ